MRKGAPPKSGRAPGSENRSILTRSSTGSRGSSTRLLRRAGDRGGRRLRAHLAPVLLGEPLEVEIDRAEEIEDAGVARAELAAQAQDRGMEILAGVAMCGVAVQ